MTTIKQPLKGNKSMTITVNSKNIESIVKQIKDKISTTPQPPTSNVLWLNTNKRVLSTRYKGKGRPRMKDYDYVPDEELIDCLREVGLRI